MKFLNLDNSERPVLSFPEEVENTCRQIYTEASGKPIWLFLSGGIDSEIIARTFLKLDIPFSCMIVRFSDDLNSHDIEYALEFVLKHKVPYHIYDMDPIEFIQECRYSDSGTLIYRFMQIHWMKKIQDMGGYCVIGSGEQRYDQCLNITYIQSQFIPYIWAKENSIEACPYFFLHNSQIIHSYALEAKDYTGEVGVLGHNIKAHVYKKYWPELKPRPKYHGYENIQNFRTMVETELAQKNRHLNTSWTLSNQQILDMTGHKL